jgi:hypothetical protein
MTSTLPSCISSKLILLTPTRTPNHFINPSVKKGPPPSLLELHPPHSAQKMA